MVGLHIFFVFLAALGLFSLLWAVMGFFLPGCRKGWLLCSGTEFVSVYLWLRGLGIVTCPLLVLDDGLDETQRRLLAQKEIALYSRDSALPELGKDLL